MDGYTVQSLPTDAVTNNVAEHRQCCTCKQVKPSFQFSPTARRCHECNRLANRAYTVRNKERINEKNRRNYYANKAAYRARQTAYEKRLRAEKRTDPAFMADQLFSLARSRARRFGVPFTIKLSDVVVPAACPVLGIPLKINYGKIGDDSATIDRIKPHLGYVPGNIVVVSNKANRVKNNSTTEELAKIAAFYMRLANES